MSDTRKKLVDLIGSVYVAIPPQVYRAVVDDTAAAMIADHLIANGVTVQELDGCEYCKEYEDLPEHFVDGKPVGRVFDTCVQTDENGLWHVEVPSGADIGIQFCPMCGRKLPEPPERREQCR